MLFDIVGRRYLFFALSLIILVPGLIGLLAWGLRPGIDFTGGTLWELIPKAGGQVDPGQVRATLQAAGQPAAQVIMAELRGGAQVTPTLQIRMPNISPEEKAHFEDVLVRAEIVAGTMTALPGREGPRLLAGRAAPAEVPGAAAESTARGQFAPGQEIQFTTVGPVVGQQVTNNAILVVAAAAGGILSICGGRSGACRGPSATAGRRYSRCCMMSWSSWGSSPSWDNCSAWRSMRSL
jgi:preprotein translocase subunit SecF